jgi:hypothetical protein
MDPHKDLAVRRALIKLVWIWVLSNILPVEFPVLRLKSAENTDRAA